MTTTTRSKPTKLTERQRNFANLLFQGSTQREAYLTIYQPQSAIEDVDAHASRLASNGKVLAELERLRAKLEPEMVMSKQQLALEMVRIVQQAPSYSDRIKAGRELSLLFGYYAPARTESRELVKFLVEYRNRDAVIPLASVPQPLLDAPHSMIVPAIEGQAIQLPARTDEPTVKHDKSTTRNTTPVDSPVKYHPFAHD